MQLLTYTPLFFLILIPIIIILYLLKQKAEDHPFSSLYLWREAYKNIEVTTPFEKLKHNLLMYLQIITMILLIIALASPYLKAFGGDYKNVLFVIDNSASMNYQYDDKNTRLEASINKAIEYIDGINEGMLISVISNSSNINIEIANTRDKKEAKEKLSSIVPTDLAGDLSNTISLVKSMTSQMESYEAIFFSDTNISLEDLNGQFIDMSSNVQNASIDYISHGFENGKMTVLVKVTNHSEQEFNSDINLYVDNTLEDIKNIALTQNESKTIYFNDISANGDILCAEINEKDGLLNDNKAYDKINAEKPKRILLVTEQNIFLEKAILTRSDIELFKTNDTDNIDNKEDFDLYIFDGLMPESIPKRGSVLYINPTAQKDLFEIAEAKSNLLISTNSSDINKYIENFQFGVNEVNVFKKPIWAESFLEFDGNCAGFIGNYSTQSIVAIGFDLHQTDLVLQSEFPILINNILDRCLNDKIVSGSKFVTGEKVEINGKLGGEEAIVTNPIEKQYKMPKDALKSTYTETNISGVYYVNQKSKDETISESFVVNFPSTESKQTASTAKTIDNNNKSTNTLKAGKDLKEIFLAAILLLLFAEWIVYIKRI